MTEARAWAVKVEEDGIAVLYGPFDSNTRAAVWAERWTDGRYGVLRLRNPVEGENG